MGVTIHFEGQLKSKDDFKNVLDIAENYAINNNLPYSFFENDNKVLARIKNEEDWDYIGATKGIKIQPHVSTDPLNLEFDKDYIIQEYCKTQFSSPEKHIEIVEFLRTLIPYFKYLHVFDEGEYWETNDIKLLSHHFEMTFKKIEDAKSEDPALNGPFRVADGRIIDLMRDSTSS